MTEIGLLLFLIWCVSVTFIFFVTRDIASPQMMFMASLGVFFSDIFISQYNLYIYAIYILLLFVVLLTTLYTFNIHPKTIIFITIYIKINKLSTPFSPVNILDIIPTGNYCKYLFDKYVWWFRGLYDSCKVWNKRVSWSWAN